MTKDFQKKDGTLTSKRPNAEEGDFSCPYCRISETLAEPQKEKVMKLLSTNTSQRKS